MGINPLCRMPVYRKRAYVRTYSVLD